MEHKPEITQVGLISMKVCVPQEWSDRLIEKWANEQSPTGISSEWRIDRNQTHVRCKCDEREGCEHLILNC